ncbi:tetratricopeptide repeat protein [Ideonella sp. DXS29W]|uniref:Tetratricopeptide repeat protein n=1 Tax=Ideonella lacteola TaxID=2984193 RepID=A0ABU9BXW5_9BURK
MRLRTATLPRSPLGFAAAAVLVGLAGAGPLAAQPVDTAASSAPAAAPASAETAEIQRLIKEGQHSQALKLIDEALVKNPKDPQMRFRRGVALSMLDRKPEALAVFQKLVDDHPDMPAPYNNIAVIYGAQGDYEKARQALERAIRTNPAYATAYQNLGDVYAQLASQAYTKALQLDKGDATVPPKLALLRELTSGANTAPPPAPAAAVAAAKPVGRSPAPTTVAAAAPAPAVSPAPPTTSPNPSPTTSPKPAAPPPAPSPAANPPAPPTAAAPAPAASKPLPPAAPPSAAAPKPAAAVASAVATAPTPTPASAASPAPASPVGNSAEVEAAVRAWASAWSKRNMTEYLGAYTPEFSGQSSSRKAWEQDRRDRIATRKQIKVELVDLRVTVDGDQATAKFKQVYSSDALSATSRKTLSLVRLNGRWVIKKEAVGG